MSISRDEILEKMIGAKMTPEQIDAFISIAWADEIEKAKEEGRKRAKEMIAEIETSEEKPSEKKQKITGYTKKQFTKLEQQIAIMWNESTDEMWRDEKPTRKALADFLGRNPESVRTMLVSVRNDNPRWYETVKSFVRTNGAKKKTRKDKRI